MTWTDMTPDQRRATLETMCKFGGEWVRRLALAWICADAINSAKLAAAFPELLQKYGPGSGFFAEVAMTQGGEA